MCSPRKEIEESFFLVLWHPTPGWQGRIPVLLALVCSPESKPDALGHILAALEPRMADLRVVQGLKRGGLQTVMSFRPLVYPLMVATGRILVPADLAGCLKCWA
jgi:hypothetical protein